MPVGTHGAVKALPPWEVARTGARLVLANAYHLHLSPGEGVVEKAGGLHGFMGWDGPLLTDSGGFQAFSLPGRTVTEEGVSFKGPGGRTTLFTPELSMAVQRKLGADVVMALDECLAWPADEREARASAARTLRWLDRCVAAWTDRRQALFGIVQGGGHDRLREESAAATAERDLPGYAIGGVSVGEGPREMARVVGRTAALLPEDRPRYAMGVGTPEDLLEVWGLGVDMSDCVVPTRFARGGTLFTNRGPLRIRHRSYRRDFYPVEPNCPCRVCGTFTRAYLRHLFEANEILGQALASAHNLAFYASLADRARKAVLEDRFLVFKREFLEGYRGGPGGRRRSRS